MRGTNAGWGGGSAELAGVEPRFEEYRGDDPVAFVISTNLHRRHLNESQRGMVSARALPMFEAQARERREATQIKGGKPPTVSANLRGPSEGKAAEHAAALVNVSPRTVEHARRVLREASPEVVAAVDRGCACAASL